MPMKRFFCLLALFLVLVSACTAPPSAPAPTATASLTASPSPTPRPTATQAPPTSTATPALIEGTLTIKVNVRSGAGMTFPSLGLLDEEGKVQILYSDPAGKWYCILYPAGPDGVGWVAAQFVRVPVWTQVPVLSTPTPSGPTGRVLQRLNVRAGPGMTFDTLGLLEADAVVSLTGKNASASWLQIVYPAGRGGRGWVTAQYIQADAAGLPVLDDYGTPVASAVSGPTAIPVTPTPTVGPAYNDNDSLANPAVDVTFSVTGTQEFNYSSQVSAPEGDPGDWLVFTPYAVNGSDAQLVFSLSCSGNGTLAVELWRGGSRLSGWGRLSCGDVKKVILLPAGQAYELHLSPSPAEGLRLVDYVLTVQNQP
jgi:uncharacterized protein YraI